MMPSQSPLQDGFVGVKVIVIPGGSLITTVPVTIHPLESVTVTL